MIALHACGERFEGYGPEVVAAVQEHKERCLAEHEHHERTTRMSLHPSVWPAPTLETT